MAIRDEDKDQLIDVVLRTAKTDAKGAFGDGKIFISPSKHTVTGIKWNITFGSIKIQTKLVWPCTKGVATKR